MGNKRVASKGWTITGVSDETREAVTAAAKAAGMPIGAWVEQALAKALKEGLEPPQSLTAEQVREIVAKEVAPVREAVENRPPAQPVDGTEVSAADRARERIRARRLAR